MKQILQNARNGEIEVRDVPAPRAAKGCVLVRVAASLVSAGTERASSQFASKNLLQKAQARPDLVRDVLSKVRRDGIFAAVSAVRSRLDQPLALGYSCAGTVVEVGEGRRGGVAEVWCVRRRHRRVDGRTGRGEHRPRLLPLELGRRVPDQPKPVEPSVVELPGTQAPAVLTPRPGVVAARPGLAGSLRWRHPGEQLRATFVRG